MAIMTRRFKLSSFFIYLCLCSTFLSAKAVPQEQNAELHGPGGVGGSEVENTIHSIPENEMFHLGQDLLAAFKEDDDGMCSCPTGMRGLNEIRVSAPQPWDERPDRTCPPCAPPTPDPAHYEIVTSFQHLSEQLARLCPRDGIFSDFGSNCVKATNMLVDEFRKRDVRMTRAVIKLAKTDGGVHPTVWTNAASIVGHELKLDKYLLEIEETNPELFVPMTVMNPVICGSDVCDLPNLPHNWCRANESYIRSQGFQIDHYHHDHRQASMHVNQGQGDADELGYEDDFDFGIEVRRKRDTGTCAAKMVPSTCTPKDSKEANLRRRINGIETRLWYFREDIFVNAFHHAWHLTYAYDAKNRRDNKPVARRGELFYYMHRFVLARYDAERLANGLGRVVPFVVERGGEVMKEGYDSGLQMWRKTRNANDPSREYLSPLPYTVRIPGTRLPAWNPTRSRNKCEKTLGNIINLTRKLKDAVRTSTYKNKDGCYVNLNLDILGDLTEPGVNEHRHPFHYGLGGGGLHNIGHDLIAHMHMIKRRQDDFCIGNNEPNSCMLQTQAAMRDPIFYRWHLHMDNIIDQHKQMLRSYTPKGGEYPLYWPGVTIEDMKVQRSSSSEAVENTLRTFWQKKELNLTNGLELTGLRVMKVCAEQLNHDPFTYKISVTKAPHVRTNRATIRIFMAPRFDEHGRRFSMQEQRQFFFPLDTFTTTLQDGLNHIERHSSESSLTRSLKEIDNEISKVKNETDVLKTVCSCGWPNHLLIPKGRSTPGGMPFDIFAIITDGTYDTWDIVTQPQCAGEGKYACGCIPTPLVCGIANGDYPSSLPMGYPFDRRPYRQVDGFGMSYRGSSKLVQDLEEYVYGIGNMRAFQVSVTHDPTRPQPCNCEPKDFESTTLETAVS